MYFVFVGQKKNFLRINTLLIKKRSSQNANHPPKYVRSDSLQDLMASNMHESTKMAIMQSAFGGKISINLVKLSNSCSNSCSITFAAARQLNLIGFSICERETTN